LVTPESVSPPVYLGADLREILVAQGGGGDPWTSNNIFLEHRHETKTPFSQDGLKATVMPLSLDEKRRFTIDVEGIGLDAKRARLADFPNGARLAAVQSWDDGIPQDMRLAKMLAKHGWRASFFLNRNSPMLTHWKELEDLGMEVGSHSWSPPPYWLQRPVRCHEEGVCMRLFLEGRVGHPVISFAYPFDYNPAYDALGDYVLRAQKDAAYMSCRSTKLGELTLDQPGELLAMTTDGHALLPRSRLEEAWKRASGSAGGIFYIWGHSYDIAKESDWRAFEDTLRFFGRRHEAWYASQGDLMVWKWLRENTRLSASGNDTKASITVEHPRIHPWWAARVPIAVRIPGRVTRATIDGKPLRVTGDHIQIPEPMFREPRKPR